MNEIHDMSNHDLLDYFARVNEAFGNSDTMLRHAEKLDCKTYHIDTLNELLNESGSLRNTIKSELLNRLETTHD